MSGQAKAAPSARSLKTQQCSDIASDVAGVDVVLGELGTGRCCSPCQTQSGSANVSINSRVAHRSKSSGFPRKEVIQPQLPLRLPCYDFTPVTDPTFDGFLPCGLEHRLRVLPASMV